MLKYTTMFSAGSAEPKPPSESLAFNEAFMLLLRGIGAAHATTDRLLATKKLSATTGFYSVAVPPSKTGELLQWGGSRLEQLLGDLRKLKAAASPSPSAANSATSGSVLKHR